MSAGPAVVGVARGSAGAGKRLERGAWTGVWVSPFPKDAQQEGSADNPSRPRGSQSLGSSLVRRAARLCSAMNQPLPHYV